LLEKLMKTVTQVSRSIVMAGAVATLALAAMGFASAAQARDNVFWSVGVGGPGVALNLGNGFSMYVAPQPVHMIPQDVYYGGRPHGHWRHDGYRVQDPRGYGSGYGPGYEPGYYPRDGREGGRHGDRR
jgi:hypothetical protein